MQDPRKVLRQHNIRMKDFVGNKITLFEKEELERAREILRKNKIDSEIKGFSLVINGELKEETVSADIGPDTVVAVKKKPKDKKLPKGGLLMKSKIWNNIQRRLTNTLAEKAESNSWKDIVRDFNKILKVEINGSKLIVRGLDNSKKEKVQEYGYNNSAVAKAVGKKVSYLKDIED